MVTQLPHCYRGCVKYVNKGFVALCVALKATSNNRYITGYQGWDKWFEVTPEPRICFMHLDFMIVVYFFSLNKGAAIVVLLLTKGFPVSTEALAEPEICYVLDGILFLYGIILTALYCKIKVCMLHVCL